MILEKSAILHHERMSPECCKMTLACDPSYISAVPGQFIMLHIPDGESPLLPRPFSIHRVKISGQGDVKIQILYRVVGAMTRKMMRIREGEMVRMVGPLGRGFVLPKDACRLMIVAGGIGVAPLIFFLETMLKNGMDPGSCDFFLGARGQEELLCRDELKEMGVKLHVTTDDGSAGDHCLVTYPVQKLAQTFPPDIIYACGPEAMLRCVVQMARLINAPCQVSIEALMACGIGACLGCAVEGKREDRYLHVCSDGPVFDAETLGWN